MNIPTIIMARGEGQRLQPLTTGQSKPSLPFAGRNCIIDFALYNTTVIPHCTVYILSSNYTPILTKHWTKHWSKKSHLIPKSNQILAGNATSVHEFIETIPPSEHIVICACDHVYKMSFEHVIQQHIKRNSDVTIASTVRPVQDAVRFGVLDHTQKRVTGFVEKPDIHHAVLDNKEHITINMGIYVFKRAVLSNLLREDQNNPLSEHDFGRNIIPLCIVNNLDIDHYTLPHNSYWSDVGTLQSYWDTQWEYHLRSCTETISDTLQNTSTKTIISHGSLCIPKSTTITKSIIHNNVFIGKNCWINRTILGKNAHLDDGVVLTPMENTDFVIIPPDTHVTKDWVDSGLMCQHTQTTRLSIQ